MTLPLVLAFCAPGPMRERVLAACPSALFWPFGDLSPNHEHILLGVGVDGCAALARRVEEGLEGVAAVVLIGPEAPWAGRAVFSSCAKGCDHGSTLPLGPLEPLRAVAERAREGVLGEAPDSEDFQDGPDSDAEPWPPMAERTYPLRLVVACHPERAVCEACDVERVLCDRAGMGAPPCSGCTGTGHALGSAEVARELSGITLNVEGFGLGMRSIGGLTVMPYVHRAALDEHAIREALAIAMERL